MKEQEILFQISQIIGRATTFAGALERIRLLLENTLGARALTIVMPEQAPCPAHLANAHVEAVLEAFDLPYRSLYSVPLRAGGKELGKLIACYASQEFHGAVSERVSQYVGEQLGMLLERSRLSTDHRELRRVLADLREELAARKACQRAEGILMARRGMPPHTAKLWISQEARRSGLSARAMAERIILGDIAERDVIFARRQRRIA